MMQLTLQIPNWVLLFQNSLPWFLPLGAALVLLLIPFFLKRGAHLFSFGLSVASIVAALICNWSLWWKAGSAATGMFLFDKITYLFMFFFLVVTFLSLLLSYPYLRKLRLFQPEYYALMLFAVFGMACMVAGSDLIIVFLGIEVMSIALYVLAGFWRNKIASVEAALKYFLMGAFASGFLLLGIAFLYGAAQTTSLPAIYQMGPQLFEGPNALYTYLAVALLSIGFGFKIALVPFHFWAADVYEGAPVVVTAFMATAVKAAAFGALIRVVWALFQWDNQTLVMLVAAGAVLTMTVGNIAALLQGNVKRMLAYSSIAHAGYILIPFVVFSAQGVNVVGSVAFYLFAYILMTIGAFAVVTALTSEDQERSDIRFFAGLGRTQPFLGFAMTLFMLSLAGIPPTIGFIGKYFLFVQAVRGGFVWLVVVAVLNSVVSVYYYLRPVMVMYFGGEKEKAPLPAFELSHAVLAVVVLCLLGVVFLGLFPDTLLQFINSSARLSLHP